MEQECRSHHCTGTCNIQEQINFQSKNGGSREGRYWPKGEWEIFTLYAFATANEGCKDPDGVKKLIETITQEKTTRGELV